MTARRCWRLPDLPDAWLDIGAGLPAVEALDGLLMARPPGVDLRVASAALDVSDGEIRAPGIGWQPLRRRAALNLASLATRSAGKRPTSDAGIVAALRARGHRPILLRIDERGVRAVLSERFVPFDDAALFGAVRAVLVRSPLGSSLVARGCLSGAVSLCRFTLPSQSVAVDDAGDAIEPGVEVRTSEFGASAVRVSPLVFRPVCGNAAVGVRGDGALRVRHCSGALAVAERIGPAIGHALDAARLHVDRWADLVRHGRRLPGVVASSPECPLAAVNDLTRAAQTWRMRKRPAAESRAHDMIDQAWRALSSRTG